MYDDDKPILPPYGPTEGMLQGLALMQRLSPVKVDAKLLRTNKVAPGNEYKVIGALRFLGIIDGNGKPTEKSRQLKTRGPSYQLAIQDIVRNAYSDLFDQVNLKAATRDQIHNYFIARLGLGVEMAAKATRFFLGLCVQSEMPLSPELTFDKERPSTPRHKVKTSQESGPSRRKATNPKAQKHPERGSLDLSPTLVLSITPETAEMGLDQLTKLFRKLRAAMKRAASED